jgi:hypothetical protein
MVLGLAAAILTVSAVAVAAPAQASPGNGWGWGQLPLDGHSVVEARGIRATLVESIYEGVTKARQDALAPLVQAGALTQDQANLIASVHNASVVAALRKGGQITQATAVLVRKALAGTNAVAAKRAAASIALDKLVASGMITADEAATIRASLGLR